LPKSWGENQQAYGNRTWTAHFLISRAVKA